MASWMMLGLLLAAGVAEAASVRVRWRPSASQDVAGYRIYLRPSFVSIYGSGVDAGLPALEGGGTQSFVVSNLSLSPGTSWVFVVTAYRRDRYESGFSNEIRVTIPGTAPTSTTTTTRTTTSTSRTTTRPPTTTRTTAPLPTVTTSSTVPYCSALPVPPLGGILGGLAEGPSARSGSCALGTGVSPETVFRWTPAVSGMATIHTCSKTDTTFDTVVYLRGGGCNGNEIVCNDDAIGCETSIPIGNSRRGSKITPAVTAGQTYFIVVDGYNNQGGGFSLTVVPPALSCAPNGSSCNSGDPCAPGVCTAGLCQPSVTAQPREIELRKFSIRRGRLLAKGSFLPSAGFDPTNTGARLEVRRADGSLVYDALLPRDSFATNKKRSVYRHKPSPAAADAEGLKRLVLQVTRDGVSVVAIVESAAIEDAATQGGLSWVVRVGNTCARRLNLACVAGPSPIVCE